MSEIEKVNNDTLSKDNSKRRLKTFQWEQWLVS